MANATGYARGGFTLRGLANMPTWQLPIVFGGLLATLTGVVTYVLGAGAGATAATTGVIYTIIFGLVGLVAYTVSRAHAQNGALMAAIAGLAMLTIAGTTGLFAGLLLLAGAIWGLAASK